MEDKIDKERVVPHNAEGADPSAPAPGTPAEKTNPSGSRSKSRRRRRRKPARSGAENGAAGQAAAPSGTGKTEQTAESHPTHKRVRPVKAAAAADTSDDGDAPRPAPDTPADGPAVPPEPPAAPTQEAVQPDAAAQTPVTPAPDTGHGAGSDSTAPSEQPSEATPEPAPEPETAPDGKAPEKAATDGGHEQASEPETEADGKATGEAAAGGDREPALETAENGTPAGEAQPAPTAGLPDEAAESPQPAEESEAQGEDPDEAAIEQSPEHLRRTAELTRTVQLSIEKLTDVPDPLPETPEEADAGPQTMGDRMRDGLLRMLKWLLLVAAFVALVAGIGIAWLYSGASPDSIPSVIVYFNGQTLETASSSWHVPVVANLFKRTYAEKNFTEPEQLGNVENAKVTLRVLASNCDTALTITDEADQTVFEGTVEDFDSFRFAQNGTYTGTLRVYRDNTTLNHEAGVSGEQVYRFQFAVKLKPGIRLNTTVVQQGSVAVIRVSGIVGTQAPVLRTELSNTGFFEGQSGWIVYLPIEYDREPGEYTLSVTAGGYTETLSLTVRERPEEAIDLSSQRQLTTPYLGLEDTPAEVQALLNTTGGQAAWAKDGFVQPFTDSVEIALPYGATEYVGRTRAQRQAGTGSGRTSINTVVEGRSGGQLIAPADGRVLLAEELDGDAGYTVVIDHGAGVKSIFYNLRELSVKAGQTVIRGQQIAVTNRATIGEVRIGTVPVEPLSIWRGQCDALRYY